MDAYYKGGPAPRTLPPASEPWSTMTFAWMSEPLENLVRRPVDYSFNKFQLTSTVSDDFLKRPIDPRLSAQLIFLELRLCFGIDQGTRIIRDWFRPQVVPHSKFVHELLVRLPRATIIPSSRRDNGTVIASVTCTTWTDSLLAVFNGQPLFRTRCQPHDQEATSTTTS
jgi:hypothetical protein